MTTSPRAITPFNPRVPFSRADARAAGIPEGKLRTPAYQRLFFDCYLSSTVSLNAEVRADAALRRLDSTSAYASHHTAAEIWGLPVTADGLIHITESRDDRRNRCRGILTHRPLALTARITVGRGLRVSPPDQVFCELAAIGVGLVELVVVGDAMLKSERASRESLTRAVDTMTGSGVRVARRALGYLRDGVDSAMESRLRMLLVLAGFPEPTVNVILRKYDGSWGRRFDLCYLALKLIIEYDGAQHGELDQRETDNDRREQLARLGYTIVPVTAHGIYTDPAKTLRRVADALRELDGRPPARWKPEWRQHFPTKRT